jgi:hypothetical protein
MLLPRTLDRLQRIDRDPPAPQRRTERTAEHRLTFPNRRHRQRPALMRRTPLVAYMVPLRTVLKERSSLAPPPAHPQLGV